MIQINFPPGDYFFDGVVSIPSNYTLNGAGADSTLLLFDLDGASSDLLYASGTTTGTSTPIAGSLTTGEFAFDVTDADLFEVGDWVQIVDNDDDLITSDWSAGKTGQILQIVTVSGDEIEFDSPFRRDYLATNEPYLELLNMKENVSVQNLKIERMDATDAQTNNISFRYAVNCQVSCVESVMTNFAHVRFEFSSNCVVKGSYFNDAFSHGSGGKGYGVVCQFATGECLITDNNFERLRHSMLVQAGANGNVYSYNNSIDPYWTDVVSPSNAAGDIVLHGNYVYLNLFEGNICQNIIIDNSQGTNGPYNTFFRNRAALYGIFMNSSPASDAQNFIANEITDDGVFKGLYVLEGTDHFEYGNNQLGETVPVGTVDLPQASLYLDEIPFYYETYSSWPPIGYPNELDDYNNEAFNNLSDGFQTQCENLYEDISVVDSDNYNYGNEILIYPNPTSDLFTIEILDYKGSLDNVEIKLYNLNGQFIQSFKGGLQIDLSTYECGTYLVRVKYGNESISYNRIVKD